MTTTINADNVTGGAVVTGDNSGVLGLQAAGNTALTLNSSRAVGVGASPNYGTSGQVLTSAGSAAAPTWSAIPATNLATGVTGTLPTTNGGTGSTSTTYCSLTTNVTGTLPTTNGGTGSTSTTYCSLTTNVTGTLPLANGGTGQTTKAAAFNALSPITSTGDLILGNGSNSATRLAIGTNGQVLTSNGTTASWASASGSSLVYISGQNLSGTGQDYQFTGLSGYNMYCLIVEQAVHSENAGNDYLLQFQINGSTWLTSDYDIASARSNGYGANGGQPGIQLGTNIYGDPNSFSCVCYINGMNKTSYKATAFATSYYGGPVAVFGGSAGGSSGETKTGIRIRQSGYTLVSGRIALYGVKTS